MHTQHNFTFTLFRLAQMLVGHWLAESSRTITQYDEAMYVLCMYVCIKRYYNMCAARRRIDTSRTSSGTSVGTVCISKSSATSIYIHTTHTYTHKYTPHTTQTRSRALIETVQWVSKNITNNNHTLLYRKYNSESVARESDSCKN